jgi:hypothetical protein
VLFAQGKYREAAGTIHAVLADGPGWDWATMSGLYPSVQVYTTHLRALEDFARTNPDSADARFLLGYHYLTEGYHDAGILGSSRQRALACAGRACMSNPSFCCRMARASS